MKTFNVLGFRCTVAFSLQRVKRVTMDIPTGADDVGVYNRDDMWDDQKHLFTGSMIRYWKGLEVETIPLPKCKRAECVSCTSLYNADRSGYSKNRKMVVDLFL